MNPLSLILGLLAPLVQFAAKFWDEKGKEITAYVTGRRAQKAADRIANLETTVDRQSAATDAQERLPHRSQREFADWLRRGGRPD